MNRTNTLSLCRQLLGSSAIFIATMCFSYTTYAEPANSNVYSNGAVLGKASLNIAELRAHKSHSARLDALSEQALEAILLGDWAAAANNAQALNDEFPDYALGQLLLAEAHTVLGQSAPLIESLPNYSGSLVNLLLEARSRARQIETGHEDNYLSDQLVPEQIIQVGTHIDHVILVDLASSALFLFDTSTDQPRLMKEHYISSGEGGFGKLSEGDLKSPLGVYQINGFRNDESLPSLYGSGALMLNYPNVLDRSLGRSGSGIWLHGNPRVNRSRSPRSSEGCVTMANDHLIDLYDQIDIRRTHVVLSHNIQWTDWTEATSQRERFQELFEQYRSAWINNHINDLNSIYSADALPSHVKYAGRAVAKRVSSDLTDTTRLSPIGVELDALSALRSDQVSLVMNPDIRAGKSPKHLVMAFELPGKNAARITIYWEQTQRGYWQIRREEIDAKGA